MNVKLEEMFVKHQIIKKELDEKTSKIIRDNLNESLIEMYVYADHNQVEQEIFFVCDFTEQDSLAIEFVKQLNSNVAYYINFVSENKEVFYNTYLILLINEEFETKNGKTILEISLDKNVMRKIFINMDNINSLDEKLPFIEYKTNSNSSLELEEHNYEKIISKFNETIGSLEVFREAGVDSVFKFETKEV